MLTTLRNNAQSWIIKVVLGIIVVTFVISFGVVNSITNRKEVIVKVGDTEILVTEYMRQYQEELDRLRQRFPDNAEALAAQLNLRQQVLDRIVDRHLLLTAAARQGVIVGKAEVEHRYRVENEQVRVDYAYVDPGQVKLARAPTEEELKAYYQA